MIRDPFWRDDAACRDYDPQLFDLEVDMPRTNEGYALQMARLVQAREACWTCPRKAECAEDGAREKGSGMFAGVVLVNGRPHGHLNRMLDNKDTRVA